MAASVECSSCGAPFGVEALLDHCPTSSIEASAVFFSCPKCHTECPVAMQPGRIAWARNLPIESWLAMPGLEVRAFSGFVHAWYDGRHWAIADRQAIGTLQTGRDAR